ncbi:BlaI/MecI/CopY family transcriptional regulator [uncultured Methanolobus sp.]|uniref:BlaI/MecI/CopY family transcriptional regulator n=1 Tax=uncultured Methanolobus sp. TaxID=218300 RepID=UPI002AAC0625|nr:BlaI/MecI/CopY family transcriptional regulator [uncultured Methanolobus sp.]
MKASISKGSVGESVLQVLIESGELPSSEIIELSGHSNTRSVQTAISRLVGKGLVAVNRNQSPQCYYITQAGEQEYIALHPDADVELNDWSLHQEHETKEQETEKQEQEHETQEKHGKSRTPKANEAQKQGAAVAIKQGNGTLKITISIEIEGIQ